MAYDSTGQGQDKLRIWQLGINITNAGFLVILVASVVMRHRLLSYWRVMVSWPRIVVPTASKWAACGRGR